MCYTGRIVTMGLGMGGMGEVGDVPCGEGVSLQHTSGDALVFLLPACAGSEFFDLPPARVRPSSHFLFELAAAGQASAHF